MLASSAELHHCFHADSKDSSHHCIATDFQSGIIEQPACSPVYAQELVLEDIEYVRVSVEARRSLPVHLCGSLLEHGPPVIA